MWNVSGCHTITSVLPLSYQNLQSHDLQRYALQGVLQRSSLPATEVEHVVVGTVIQEVNTSNIAREVKPCYGKLHVIVHKTGY